MVEPSRASRGRYTGRPLTQLQLVGITFILTLLMALMLMQAADGGDEDVDCSDFATESDAQSFYEAHGGPEQDKYGLDHDRDGAACEVLK